MPVSARSVAVSLLVGASLVGPSAAADQPTKQECVLANENAQDLQHAGKLRDARARLAVCVADTCPGAVREDCAQRLAEVDKAMPTVVFDAKDAAGNDVSAVRVTMDGQALAERLVGTPIPIDPGEHHFVFDAEGMRTAEKTLVLHEGDRDRRELIVMQISAPVAGSAAPTQPAGPAAADDGSTRRMVGLALGGAGVVGALVAGIEGIASNNTYTNALRDNCGSTAPEHFTQRTACNQTGVDAVGNAHTQATISTIAFIGGAAFLGAGAVIYFTAPKGDRVSVVPSVGPGTAALNVRGTW